MAKTSMGDQKSNRCVVAQRSEARIVDDEVEFGTWVHMNFMIGKDRGIDLPKDDEWQHTPMQTYLLKPEVLKKQPDLVVPANAAKWPGQVAFRMIVNSLAPRTVSYAFGVSDEDTQATNKLSASAIDTASMRIEVRRVCLAESCGIAGGMGYLMRGLARGDVVNCAGMYVFKSEVVVRVNQVPGPGGLCLSKRGGSPRCFGGVGIGHTRMGIFSRYLNDMRTDVQRPMADERCFKYPNEASATLSANVTAMRKDTQC